MRHPTKSTWLVSVITVALMVAVGLFYSILYPHHLHYYEWLQLFQFTTDYFREVALLPGGLADYAGLFLTQFFHLTWAGAFIMALLIGLTFLCSWLVVGRGLQGKARLLWAIVLLLPVRFLWVNSCDENAMPSLYVAFIVSLLTVWIFARPSFRCGVWTRSLLWVVLEVVLYLAVGPLSFLAVALLIVRQLREGRGIGRWLLPLAMAFVAVVMPFAAHHYWGWPLLNFFLGIHYFRFPYIQQPYIWEAAGLMVLIDVLSHLKLTRFHQWIEGVNAWALSLGTLALMCLVVLLGVRRAYHPNNEVAMMYDDLVLGEQWEEILHQAALRTPKHPACVQCINLAMAMTGTMGDLLFRVPQPGADALLPQFSINFSRPLTAGVIYLNLGWTNTAQRFVYEAQESIPDYQKSARCYRYLAQTHIIRGEKALARKYLKKLQHTLFYSDWADEQMRLLADPDPKAIAQHPFYGPMMRGAVRDDYFFSPDVMAMIGNYCTTTPHNNVATQYMLAVALVERKLDTFVTCFNLNQYLQGEEQVPAYYQQALALHWYQQNHTLDDMPYAVEPQVLEGLRQFLSDMEAKAPLSVMQQRYMFSYWYYYFSAESPSTGPKGEAAS